MMGEEKEYEKTARIRPRSGYRAFLQKKLWRDKAVDLMEKMGSVIDWRRLSDNEFDMQLRHKLIEEAHEVCAATSTDDLLSELADLQEVIEGLSQLHQITRDHIEEARHTKRLERGGFQERVFVEVAHHLRGSFGEAYCLRDPLKYPEIEDRIEESGL